MKSIHFLSLDDLLAFLMQCENYGLLGDNPEDYEFLHVGRGGTAPRYALEFDEGLWPQADSMAPLFAGAVREEPVDPASFIKVHVNELLLALPLQQQAQARGYVPSLLLGCRAQPGDSVPDLAEILYAAWREVPKGDEEESVFRFSFGRTRWLTVEIPSVRPGFEFRKFEETLLADSFRDKISGRDLSLRGVKAFLPAWTGREDCFLFVESGYGYPKPLEFSFLYHQTISAQRNLAGEITAVGIDHVVLLERDPLVDARGAGLWVQGKASLLGSAPDDEDAPEDERFIEFSRSGDVLDLQIHKFDRWPEFVQSHPVSDNGDKLRIELRLGDTCQSVGAVHELEARIGRHQRSIEELESRKARLLSFASSEFLAIYVFEQPDPDVLGAELAGFLKRPLSELARFQYLRARMPDGDGFEHYVISDIRMPVSQILATPCDRVYLCEGRWWDWGLNLFLKADASFNVPLDEPGLIRRVRDAIEGLDTAGRLASGYLLAERLPGSGAGASPIRFRMLVPQEGEAIRPLDELLFFTNELGDGTGSVLETAAVDFQVQARDHIVAADEETTRAAEELCSRAAVLTAQAEGEWEEVRERAQAVLTQARMADAALSATETAYGEAPANWVHFVENVQRLDDYLSRARLEAFGRWYLSEEQREELGRRLRALKLDVSEEIREMGERTAALQQSLNEEIEELREEVGELELLLQGIDRRIADAEMLTNRFAAAEATAVERLRDLEAEKDEAVAGQRRAQAAEAAAESKAEELETEREKLRTRSKALSELEAEVERRMKDHETAATRFDERSDELFAEIDSGKKSAEQSIDRFLRMFEERMQDAEELLRERKAFAALRKDLRRLTRMREASADKGPGFFARLFGRRP